MKYLALDIGEKRIGVAVTDEEGIIARPLSTLDAGEDFMGELGKIILAEKPTKIIIGLPRHMDGREGDAAENIRQFGTGIEHEFKVEVDFQDESLSSVEAEKRLRERGFEHKMVKALVDAEAASVILEDYLAER